MSQRPRDPHGPRTDLRSVRLAAQVATVGLTLAISIAIGVFGGWWLDQKLGTRFLVIVGTLLGIIAGFKQLIQSVIRATREQERIEAESRGEEPDE
ncbi:MAG: AtpZ/AtpI family protein [Armatimonadota bacterium]